MGLSAGNVTNKPLHSLRTLLPHSLRDVAVNVKGKACGSMAEISLNGFYIVAAFDGYYGVAMPEIVEALFWNSDIRYKAFKVLVNREMT